MKIKSLTVEQSIAAYWLDFDSEIKSQKSVSYEIQESARRRGFNVPADTLQTAMSHLNQPRIDGDVGVWVVFIGFMGHPHTLWNFMLDAIAMAVSDEHLEVIAVGLVEQILSDYGSLIELFEEQAKHDQKFGRMLTGVWRHRISDDVWQRLRAIQSEITAPLPNMLTDSESASSSEALSLDVRKSDDKGYYVRNAAGEWQNKANKPD